MQKVMLIGLGGYGQQRVAALRERLRKAYGAEAERDCRFVVIDTDQGELQEAKKEGVETVCLSTDETVGRTIECLPPQAAEWCPSKTVGRFAYSFAFNGASQCRLLSRLCWERFCLRQQKVLDQVLGPRGATEEPTLAVIVTSLAGGTGSGIFLQVAAHIKRLFARRNQTVEVRGVFAGSRLFERLTTTQAHTVIHANAYAAAREWNAFRLAAQPNGEVAPACEVLLPKADGMKLYDAVWFVDSEQEEATVLESVLEAHAPSLKAPPAVYSEGTKNGYYRAYVERIGLMEDIQEAFLTPHLDVRWHQRGWLPLIDSEQD